MKFQVINDTSYNKLNLIDVSLNLRKLKIFYVGDKNEKLISSSRKIKVQKEIVTDFYKKLRTAHVTAAAYIKNKYAINNPLLKSVCALEPKLRQSSLNYENLLNLKPYFETFLSNDFGEFSTEIQKYITDSELPLPKETERLEQFSSSLSKHFYWTNGRMLI